MSPVAYALFQYIRRQPDGQNLIIEEIQRALRASKTAIRWAFAELELEGLVSLSREV